MSTVQDEYKTLDFAKRAVAFHDMFSSLIANESLWIDDSLFQIDHLLGFVGGDGYLYAELPSPDGLSVGDFHQMFTRIDRLVSEGFLEGDPTSEYRFTPKGHATARRLKAMMFGALSDCDRFSE